MDLDENHQILLDSLISKEYAKKSMLILNGNALKIKLKISFHFLKERLFIIKENLMLNLSLER